MSTDLHTLVGPYALDALDDGERDSFERHLHTCETCRAEAGEFVETAARLGAAVEYALTVPPGMRARVLEAVSRTPQERPNVRSLTPATRSSTTSPGPGHQARRGTVALAAAAALLAAVGIGVGVQQLEGNRAEDVAVIQAKDDALIADVLADEDRVLVDRQLKSGLHVTVVRSDDANAAVVSLRDLPALGGGRAFQTWRLSEGPGGVSATSAGVIDADEISRSRATVLVRDVKGVDLIAVTEEPAGGSPQPTSQPFVSVELPT